MVSINDIIMREVNPFDLVNTKVGNFWNDNQDYASVVESIHQEVINDIESYLDLVSKDNRSRTLLLVGDSGSGKSYLLGRLKKTFNSKAFFAYIGPWADNDYIWRHILRYTVDSLVQIPEGQQESQLILWLKSLSAFTKRSTKKNFADSIWQSLLNDRQKFIKHLKNEYKLASIYNPEMFFGVLYDLTNPELSDLASEWLRGDDLSEESMQALKVKFCIDTEDAAKNILANFGKISTQTQPIVLCFDQVETTAKFDSNPQPLFNINTTIHNDNIKNFLIIISIVKNPWMRANKFILQADKARIEKDIQLKPINLNQAEALWAYRLQPLHQAANLQPDTSIFPLTTKLLQYNFPGGKALPRNIIILGRQQYQEYKELLIEAGKGGNKDQAEFELIWLKEIKNTQERINQISYVAAHDLIKMLQLSLDALELLSVKTKFINGKYDSSSLSYQHHKVGKRGVIWTEDANMVTFFNVMNAAQKVIQQSLCQKLYLIRMASVGDAKLKGNQIYQQIFKGTRNIHIKPNLESVHILATYQSLVNSCISQELLIGGKTIQVPELQDLMRKSKILENCTVLQDLGLIAKDNSTGIQAKDLQPIKDFLLNLITTQQFLGISTLLSQAQNQYPNVSDSDIQGLIDSLRDEDRVKLMDTNKNMEQLICLVAK
ncbi:hypothetical protein DSM106972_057230 [Dulcicalothrix desertica PCC 7102]|uniref:KAP NTPase domain-containing protein n=1 Tax=Dulcicalothrix desertica PCC 7102 TaxID=232991 RepID=A0A3S1IUV6_9CYAN|nr:ATP-binding protein [Dulcicalothrix desertica]RUT02803.1 hypothetical protein DSM106972_057230 [Dulcicalothrix desertica PCC 7102]TWH38963.1 hypothetical protein CAL7102_08165 [Dulcicalothrix desertica PCC 7102]